MTQQEMKKLRVIDQVIAKSITVREAAGLLNLSERQVLRLKKGVMEQGASFIIHKNRGRKPSHAIPDTIKDEIVKFKQSDTYKGANFTHFKELLEKYEKISVSYPSIYRILSEAGIISPKKKRKGSTHHRRKRKAREGLLIQIDASPHTWFDETITSLHGAIDDATGKICALHLEKNECLLGYFKMAEQMLTRNGIPVSVYSDRHTIFKSPKAKDVSIEQQLKGKQINLTQFGTAMEELGINVLFAGSPQAKGRIERLWETLQSRLPIEFKIHKITTFKEANDFLIGYVDKFNYQFAIEPQIAETAFRSLDKGVNLSTILCIREQRVVSEGSGFSYCGQYYQLIKDGKNASLPKKTKIIVLDRHKESIKAMYNGVIYETIPLAERPRAKVTQALEKITNNKTVIRPPDNHPWRIPKQRIPKLSYEESDREILEALFNSSRAWA